VLGKLHYLEVHNLEVFEQSLLANAIDSGGSPVVATISTAELTAPTPQGSACEIN